MTAFDLAERLQTPVFVMSDLDIGMNNWMSDPFTYPETPVDRGKVLSKEDVERLGGFARYKDVDGDGIGYRTLPGTEHPKAAWFARGSGHNERAQYSERPDDYANNLDRLNRKWETAREMVPGPVLERRAVSGASNGKPGAKIGIIAFGSSHWAVVESVDRLRDEQGLQPITWAARVSVQRAVQEFIAAHERVYVVDQNRDAQMLQLIKMDIAAAEIAKLRSVRHYNGHPLEAAVVTERLWLC